MIYKCFTEFRKGCIDPVEPAHENKLNLPPIELLKCHEDQKRYLELDRNISCPFFFFVKVFEFILVNERPSLILVDKRPIIFRQEVRYLENRLCES